MPSLEKEISMNQIEERRQFKRYQVKQDNSAFVAIRPLFQRLGMLKDVSLSGVGFKYVLREDLDPISETDASFNVDLFVSGNEFYLPGVPCKLAYDRPSRESASPFTVDLNYRECGIKFEKLTKSQKDEITHFLEKYTVGEG